MKEICLADPEKKLFLGTSKGKREIVEIFAHIKLLTYEQRPDYAFIRSRLESLMTKEYIKINNMSGNYLLYDERNLRQTDSPTKDLGKTSKNVVNSSFTNSNNNIILPFPTAFDNYSNLLDNSMHKNNFLNNSSSRKMFYGMKQNDPNLNISNFNFGLQNDLLGNNNKLSQTSNNQMTKRKRKRDEIVNNFGLLNDPGYDLFRKDQTIPDMNNITNNIPFNNNMNQIPISNPNAQNQIFIINQFNKTNMTDLEKCLLNFLIPKTNMNAMPGDYYQAFGEEAPNIESVKSPNYKETNINNADKLLINNIKEKLKPVNIKASANSPTPINNINPNLSNINNVPMTNYSHPMTTPMFPQSNLFNCPNNNLNLLNSGSNQLFPDMNVLINNFTNMTNPNQLYSTFSQAFNNINNFTNMDIFNNILKLYETATVGSNNNVELNKLNYGYPDINKLLASNIEGSNILNNNSILDQLKQNIGCYSQLVNDLFVSSNKLSNNNISNSNNKNLQQIPQMPQTPQQTQQIPQMPQTPQQIQQIPIVNSNKSVQKKNVKIFKIEKSTKNNK
jgi:hypothetical protein